MEEQTVPNKVGGTPTDTPTHEQAHVSMYAQIFLKGFIWIW